jgi:aspartate aminotransferase-like enzyme
MRRRGFLGSLAAAIAAYKVAPTAEAATLKPSGPPPMLASGTFNYEHQGVSIIRPDDNVYVGQHGEYGGYHTDHLGENGRLVAVTYPLGDTIILDHSDAVVRKSLGRTFNHPDYDDHSQPFVDKSRL